MISIIENIINSFIELGERIFNYIFEGVDFTVIWNWLPSDIGSAALSFIAILFAFALIGAIRKYLPF